MNSIIFKQYREIKDKIAKLEAERDELELVVIEGMDQDGLRQAETPFGSFFLMGRKTYEYPQNIIDLQEGLKKAKKVSENDGTALLKRDSQHVRLVIPKI